MNYIIIIIITIVPLFLNAQTDHFTQQNAIKISPIEFGFSQFEMSYERYIKDRNSSISISPSIILKEDVRTSKEGFQIAAQYRVYLSHLSSDQRSVLFGFHNIGFYAGVYGLYLDFHEDYQFNWWDNSTNQQINADCIKDVQSYEGGALLGVQFDITKKMLIDFYIGGGVRFSDFTDTKYEIIDKSDYYNDISIFEPEYKGVKPKIGLQLGFLF